MKPRANSGSGAARPAPGTAARVLSAAAGVLGEVLAEGVNAEEALARVQSEPQRAAIHAIALGTLRWYLRLAPAVASMLARPEAQTDARLRALLVTAIHQIEYSSHAHSTTVAASVDAARLLGLERAAGFINAILRRYLREREAILSAHRSGPGRTRGSPALARRGAQGGVARATRIDIGGQQRTSAAVPARGHRPRGPG